MMAGQRADPTQRLGLSLAVLAGVVSVALSRAPMALVPARLCAGLPELGTSWLARVTPDLPLSMPLTWLNGLALAVGIAWTTRLAQRLSGGLIIGTAAGAAAGVWASASPQFALLHSAGLLVTAASVQQMVCVRDRDRGFSLWAALTVVAAIWPQMAVVCGLAFALASASRQSSRVILGLGVVAMMAVASLVNVGASSPSSALSVAACLAPGPGFDALANGLVAVSTVGPYVCALAALGLFARRDELVDRRSLSVVVFVLGSLLISQHPALPVLATLLCLAAAGGMAETVRACRSGPGGRLAALLLVALVPVLAWQSRHGAPLPIADVTTYGHQQVSLGLMRRLLVAVPPGARIVSEDATTDVLVRTSQQAGTPERDTDANLIGASLARHERVFALPLSQEGLGQLGYRLEDVSGGLAEVRQGTECRPATTEWRSLPEFAFAPSFTLVARTSSEEGPVVVYATFDTRPTLSAVQWPPASLRGFYTTIYDLGSVDDRAHLSQDLSDDAAPANQVGGGRPFVARLELWRTPAAPLRLTVDLGVEPRLALARVIARSGPKRLLLCPTYLHRAGRLGE